MKKTDINEFNRQKKYLVCIDSDGTAIDAMNAKHNLCHGPAFIAVWKLSEHATEIQAMWNEINLFRKTRGVNRFIALVKILEILEGIYTTEPELLELKKWVETTDDLSNQGLKHAINNQPDIKLFHKALEWSIDINQRIASLSYKDKPPFQGVREFLEYAESQSDIAVISSSNMSAIYEEWKEHGLLEYVDVMTSQEVGPKSECIKQMLHKGYDPKNVMMIGDAYPDVDAAIDNGVWFYPIRTNKESTSWHLLTSKYFDSFIHKGYMMQQQELLDRFTKNFNENGADDNES